MFHPRLDDPASRATVAPTDLVAWSRRAPGGLVLGFAVLMAAVSPAVRAQSCAGVSPSSNTALSSVAVVTGLTGRPLYITAPPGDTTRLFILEQNGFIRIWKRGSGPTTISTFLDISAKVQASPFHNEMGLVGLTFDPNYASNGHFYVDYTEGPLAGPWFSVIARYTVSANPDVADATSELRLLRFAQPEDNHKGGQLFFGPDGYLYISTGDGGGGGDQHGTCGNGENKTVLLGKLLRIDPNNRAGNLPSDCGGTANYKIPADNPFVNGPGGNCDEIWAYGLRNPWRDSFDPANGDFYIADVGQNCWEEVDYAPGGGRGNNYGWRQMEGNHCYNNAQPTNCNPPAVSCSGSPACNDPSLVRNISEYGHTGGACSITGGYVYRGCRMPNFLGTYFYGDYCAGFVHSFQVVGGVATNPRDWTSQIDPGASLPNSLTSFGIDAEGEMYIANRGGTILKILPPFADLEVSGPGAGTPFTLTKTLWSWEDLQYSTMHPVSAYRVYRGLPAGLFTCIFRTTVPQWTGDPSSPAPGGLFAYVVTAVDAAGEESRSSDPPANLSPAACP